MREAVRKPSTSLAAKRSFSSLGAGQNGCDKRNHLRQTAVKAGYRYASACVQAIRVAQPPKRRHVRRSIRRLGCPHPQRKRQPTPLRLHAYLLKASFSSKGFATKCGIRAKQVGVPQVRAPVEMRRRSGGARRRRYQAAKADRAPQRRSCRPARRPFRFGERWRPNWLEGPGQEQGGLDSRGRATAGWRIAS